MMWYGCLIFYPHNTCFNSNFRLSYEFNKLNTYLSISQVLGVHMSSGEAAEMGDILATEADLLGMIMEVANITISLFKKSKK